VEKKGNPEDLSHYCKLRVPLKTEAKGVTIGQKTELTKRKVGATLQKHPCYSPGK